MSYRHYQIFEDFLLDDTFRQYVEGSENDSVAYWNDRIATHPEMKEDIQKAREVLITLLNTRKERVSTDKNKSLEGLLYEIDRSDKPGAVVRYLSNIWFRIAAIIVLAVGISVVWNSWRNHAEGSQMVAMNEIIVPIGEKSQVILSDGTHVWINSGSCFTYPAVFTGKSRNVSLEGEAYFEVTKKNGATFRVNTNDAEIQVLGTSFNVKAYPEDQKTQTTVVTGVVKVESKKNKISPVILQNNQMAVLKKPLTEEASVTKEMKSELTIVDEVNTSVITSWKDQLLVFSDETFEDIAVKMERWYNVRIRLEDRELLQERYTGKFVHNETIYEVLEAIKMTTPIDYSVSNNEIVINRK